MVPEQTPPHLTDEQTEAQEARAHAPGGEVGRGRPRLAAVPAPGPAPASPAGAPCSEGPEVTYLRLRLWDHGGAAPGPGLLQSERHAVPAGIGSLASDFTELHSDAGPRA